MRSWFVLLFLFSWITLYLLGTENGLFALEAAPPSEKVLIYDLQAIKLIQSGSSKQEPWNGRAIEIEGFEIPGNQVELEERLKRFLHQPITATNLFDIKQIISDHYISSHYPFVLVEIPKQNITSGVLRIAITESRLGDIAVEGNQWTSSNTLKRYIRQPLNQPIDENQLLRNVSFINRNPFRKVDLVFTPGKKQGTTDLILSTKDRRPLRLYMGTDNTGVDSVGENRWYTGLNWGNAFGLDHVFAYQFTTSYALQSFQAHTLEYIAPLFWGHILTFYGGYSEVSPHVQRPLKRNDGWSMQASGRYITPLKIYPYLEHEVTGGFDFKRSNNTFEFTEQFPIFGNSVNLTQFVVGYSGNYESNQCRIDFGADLFWSPGQWIADQSNAAYESLRLGAVNHWVYFRGTFTYLQRLLKDFSLFFSAAGQASTQALLPSEQFGLGGYNTVRGYEEREVNKDDALLLNLEARSPVFSFFKKPRNGFQFLAFIDYGWGINIEQNPGTQKADYLLGVGPGLRYTIDPYLTARLDWGVRLHNKASLEGNWNKLHFSVVASF